MKQLMLASLSLLVLGGCGGASPSLPTRPLATPSPDRRFVVVPGAVTGPTAIAFVSADPSPGATVTGCGPDAAGCGGRLRMTFRLTPTGTGPVLWVRVFLHAPSKRACFVATGEPLALRAGEARVVEVVFTEYDACATPFEVATMAAMVEGTVEVGSRQEWALHYSFTP